MGRSYPRSTPRPNLILCKSRTLLPENKNHFASKPVTASRHHCSRSVGRPICRWRKFAHLPPSPSSFILPAQLTVRYAHHINRSTAPRGGEDPPRAFPSSHQTCTNNIQLKLTKSPTGSRDFPPSSIPRFRRLQTLRHDL